jgi:Na+/H+ antiporter NhaD/arsenite permease-like protein
VHDAVVTSAAMAALSNIVSNVPAVISVAARGPESRGAGVTWLVMAMSSTFAGNLTLLGSMANLIVAGSARKRVASTSDSSSTLRAGAPVAALTIAWGDRDAGARRALSVSSFRFGAGCRRSPRTTMR